MRNKIFNRFIFEQDLKQWQAADLLNMSPETLCRKLRYDLPETEQKELVEKMKTALCEPGTK